MDFFFKGAANNKIVDEVKSFYDDVIQSSARKRHEKLWYECNAFYEGYQWLEYNQNTQEHAFYRDYQNGKIRTAINQIQPITDKQIARILKKKPRLTGTPENSNSDPELWLVGNQLSSVFAFLEDKMNMQVKYYEVMLEAFTCGTGWINFFWDDRAGDNVPKEYPVMDNAGNIIGVETRLVNTGDVNCEVFSPFDIIISPTVQRYENIRTIQTRKYQNPNEILEEYNLKVNPDTRHEDDSVYGKKFRNLINKVGGGTDIRLEDTVMKIIHYERPSEKFPKGRYVVIADGKVLDYREELPTGDINIVPFWCKKRHNKILGDTFIRQLIAPQRQNNRIISSVLEILYGHSYPYWAIEKGSGLLKKGIRGEPLQILEYNSGSKEPHQVAPPPLPGYVFQTQQMIMSGMQDIASQHDVTKGENPAGLNNNQALMNLMEADDVTISMIEQLFYRSVEMCGQKIKNLLKYYDEDRLIQVSGDNSPEYAGESFIFTKASVDKLQDIRVKIEAVPDLPFSRAGRIQLIADMAKEGIINMADEGDRRMARKTIDFTGITGERSLDEKNAIRENITAKQGKPIDPPEPYEDHNVHLYTHYQWMKTPEYKALRAQAPQIHDMMMQHTEATKQMIPPPPKPEVPKRVSVNVKAESGAGNDILINEGILPPPPPPQMPPQGPMGEPPMQLPPDLTEPEGGELI